MISRQNNDLEGRHIASMTNSGAIVINLQQLQNIDIFTYEMVLLQQSDSKVHLYAQDKQENNYIMVVPLHFCSNKKSKEFVDLLCLCSQTITIPSEEEMLEDVERLLNKFCLKWRIKRGNSVVKLYIERDCWVTYLDFVTFQSVQLKGNGSKQLISMKKQNAFQYCLNSFRQELLPLVYGSSEESLQEALECCTTKISEIYFSLACNERFEVVYQVMNPHSATLARLLKQVEKQTVCRKITTIGDEECQELINEQISKIINKEFAEYEQQLTKMKKAEQQIFLVKIMHTMIQKLRSFKFEINDQKYLFVSSKILEKVYEMHERQLEVKDKQNKNLQTQLETKKQEIDKLKGALTTKQSEQTNRKELKPIPQEPATIKRVKTQSQYNKKHQNMTLRDVKEPLAQITNNTINNSKLQKSGLYKVKEKLKEGFRKQDEAGKLNTVHNFKKM